MNLVGQKFNQLFVLEEDGRDKHGNKMWKCQCDCGNFTRVSTHNLNKSRIKSCGCLQRQKIGQLNYKDSTNQIYGRLKALYRTNKKGSNGSYYWFCQCECGNYKIVRGDSLRMEIIQSCGCLHKEKAQNSKRYFSGAKFGFLTLIENTNQCDKRGNNIWRCHCELCGNDALITTHDLNGGRKSCCEKKSIGEKVIITLLNNNKIDFIKEYTSHTCRYPKSNALARFDFYIPSENYIIEYNGSQHYIQGKGKYNNLIKFQETQEHDAFKEEWCLENHIPLIRIPYWHLDNLSIEDLQLDTTEYLV